MTNVEVDIDSESGSDDFAMFRRENNPQLGTYFWLPF